MRTIVLDTETTGRVPGPDRLCELAASEINPETGEFVGTPLHLYVNPGIAMSAGAFAVHGLSDEFLADKPKFADVAQQVSEFLSGAVVLAHNAPFDVGFLDMEFALVDGESPRTVAGLANSVVCTLELARDVRPTLSNTLDRLCDALGVDRSVRTLHGALVDCHLLAQVYPKLMDLKAERDAAFNQFLPFPKGGPYPEDIRALALANIALNGLESAVKAEKERVRGLLEKLVDGKEVIDRAFTITFTPSTKTNWDGVVKAFLAEKDLKPYQKTTYSMTVRRASASASKSAANKPKASAKGK
jgi:DNA polymerase III subunit epsilon